MKSASAICALMVAIASGLLAQSKPTTLLKVYVGPDGLAHVVDVKGRDKVIRKEREQVGVSSPKLAADKQTAGWLIESKNCCTSYAIPTRLAIYNDRKKRLLADGLMVYDWCFVDGGLQVAMLPGGARDDSETSYVIRHSHGTAVAGVGRRAGRCRTAVGKRTRPVTCARVNRCSGIHIAIAYVVLFSWPPNPLVRLRR